MFTDANCRAGFLFLAALGGGVGAWAASAATVAEAAEGRSSSASAGRLDSDLATVRSRILAPLLTPPDKRQVASLVRSLRADGSWPDVDYESTRRSGWRTSRHLSNLLLLARAYASSKEAGGGDAQLGRAALSALDYWLAHDFQNSNWWWNRIGTPRALAPILLLLDERLSAAQRAKGIEILGRADLEMTGQNLVWMAEIVARRGILQRNRERTAAAYRRIADEIAVTMDEGIQADFSFHQHGPCLYSHGYGAGFASDGSRIATEVRGTAFAFAQPKIDLLARLVLDGHQWLARGATPDYGAIGRQVARDDQSVRYLHDVARRMLELPTGREKELAALARRSLDQRAPPLVGNRHFWRSDIMVHHRPAYYASARMYSRRNVNTDGPANGEGLRSHHIADGCNFLLRTGREYWNIFPVWDWQKIPGTTVQVLPDLVGSPRRKGVTDFVGGVSDGMYGAAAFDFRYNELTARKAWFFFDSQYVCLGAGIRCSTLRPVITTINQCLLSGEVTACDGGRVARLRRGEHSLSQCRWVHHDGVDYLFFEPTALRVRNDVQTGSWRRIASERSDDPVSKEVFSLWLEHGRHPEGAAYAYVVAPNRTADSPPSDSSPHEVRILRNEPRLQAVAHRGLGLIAAAFYEPGELQAGPGQTIAVDQPCLLLLRQSPGGVVLSVSNPKNKELAVSVRATVGGQTLRTLVQLPNGMEAGRSVTRTIRP